MIGRTTESFWSLFAQLPKDVQMLASKKYRLWALQPFHPSLQFKEVNPGIWSVRVNLQYRALGRRRADTVFWFWIGTHAEYDRLV